MSYRVIKLFTDLQDGGYKYEVGDTYPREGLTPTDERITELSGSGNKQGTPLIEVVEDVSEATEEISEAEESDEKPKRRYRRRTETDENVDE